MESTTPSYRTLNACSVCRRQYDVSFMKPGDRVRCECGAMFNAEFRSPHSPRALRCTNCGANLAEGAKSCAYCNAELALEDRGISAICPTCFARLPARAKFCLECGLEIHAQALTALPANSRCPRCTSGLRSRAVENYAIVECGACAGLWLTPGMLDDLCEHADQAGFLARALHGPAPTGTVDLTRVAYLPCALCGELMLRKNFAGVSGVIIDLCKKHGVWLDRGELEKILEFVRQGGLDRARQRELERLKNEERRVRDALESARSTQAAEGLAWSSEELSGQVFTSFAEWMRALWR